MPTQPRAKRFQFRKQDLIPILIFVLILAGLIISSNLTGRAPVIESLNKKVCQPGEIVTIYGNYFGKEQGKGKVLISGRSYAFKYQDWNSKKISFIIPEKMQSGLVSVMTDMGESKELNLLLNQQDIPEVVAGPSKPGAPYITGINPSKGTPGSVITLTGFNFGQDQAGSRVYFTWISLGSVKSKKEDIFAALIPTLDYDFDFISWADREIKVRIPDGSSPGPVLVNTDKGISSPLYLEVEEPIGKKDYSNRRTYQVSYTINIENINSEQNNGLYLWLPRITTSPEQREIKVMFSEPAPLLENYKGLMQFFFEDLLPGGKYQVRVSFMFHRYEVNTKITYPNKISGDYKESAVHLGKYTHAITLIPSTDATIKVIAKTILASVTNRRQRSNPYYQARAVYDYLIKNVSYSDYRFSKKSKIIERLTADQPSGNALDLALIFCAILRSWDIPARPVGGYLVNDKKLSKAHAWIEFYIENLGWVPVDTVLGSGNMPINLNPQDNPGDYYFGSLDNQHIALSKGIIELNQMSPRGKSITAIKNPSLQTIYEESTGNLHSYSSEWTTFEDIGIY